MGATCGPTGVTTRRDQRYPTAPVAYSLRAVIIAACAVVLCYYDIRIHTVIMQQFVFRLFFHILLLFVSFELDFATMRNRQRYPWWEQKHNTSQIARGVHHRVPSTLIKKKGGAFVPPPTLAYPIIPCATTAPHHMQGDYMATTKGIGHNVRFPVPNGLRHGRGKRVWASGATYDGR